MGVLLAEVELADHVAVKDGIDRCGSVIGCQRRGGVGRVDNVCRRAAGPGRTQVRSQEEDDLVFFISRAGPQ